MSKIKSASVPFVGVLLAMLLIMARGEVAKGQRVYASIPRNGPGVTNSSRSTDTDISNFTGLKAASFLLGADSPSWNQMTFNSTDIPANTPVYIKYTMHGSLLGADIAASAYKGSNAGSDGSPASFPLATTITLPNDTTYFSIIPSEKFNSVRVTLKPPLLIGTNTADVYYAFFISPPILNNSTICSGSQATSVISNLNPNLEYRWYNAQTGGELIQKGINSPYLTSTATYYIEAVQAGVFSSARVPVTITVNPLPEFTVTSSAATVPIGTGSVTLQTNSTASYTVQWTNQEGQSLGSGTTKNVGPFPTAGSYIFNATASNGSCTSTLPVTITVYDPNACPNLTERVYATSQNWSSIVTGGVFDEGKSVDGDVKTSAILNTGIGLLGLGTVWQNLLWDKTIPAGTPVTIKLGPAPSVLALASGISAIAFKKNAAGNMVDIGTMQSVDGSLLSLLSGENAFEFTFVPSDASGVKDYDGVRIQLGAVASLIQSVNVFHAYYNKPTTAIDCSKGDVVDVLYGAVPLLAGIGALSSTVKVTDPWNAVDHNESTYATLSNGVGLLAYAKEQIIFSSPSLPGDSLKIITSTGATILDVSLLTGFSIQRYLGNSPVGPQIESSSHLLNIKLLDGGTKQAIVLLPTPEPYDRVEIRLGGILGVLTSMRIHEVQRIANTKLALATDSNNNVVVCKGDSISLPTPSNNCTAFKWYDAPTGGNVISGTVINTSLYDGPQTFYIQPVRYGCEQLPRGAVHVTINQPAITLGSSPIVCMGAPDATLTYSALTCATKYRISWDPTATAAGFLPINNTPLTDGTILIPIPNGTTTVPALYNGFLTISNGPSVNVTYSFTIKINAKPPSPQVHITAN